MSSSQFSLFRQRRYLPFFITQFLGAFNDNVFKNALIVLIAFQGLAQSEEQIQFLSNLSAMLFILPFFLFSSTAGQYGDSHEKSALIRYIKLAEILIMSLAAIGFLTKSLPLLLFVLFLTGTQSAVFGPVKYGYLPQHLQDQELVGGNGLLEMGTFLAILLGMIIGNYLMASSDNGVWWVCLIIVLAAVSGYTGARHIPVTPAVSPGMPNNWNIFSQTLRTINIACQSRMIFLSVLGISWFWFIGSVYMIQFPNYTRSILQASPEVYTLLLAVFCVGISVGSVLCERLSHHIVESGLVPLGALGLTLFGIDLFFSAPDFSESQSELLTIKAFIAQSGSWRTMLDIVGIGIFGGFYIVPLYAIIQQRADHASMSQTIAANNILNAFFMVIASVFSIIILSQLSFSENELFLLVSVLNILVTGLIFFLEPEFVQRFYQWITGRLPSS